MHWYNITAKAQKLQLDALEQWLWDHGAVSVTVEDAQDKPIFEPPPGTQPVWEHSLVTGLFEDDADVNNLTLALEESGFELSDIETIADKPWEREWLERFKPMQFGQRLWICPTGYELDPQDKIIVKLDPGLAFGTGTHETTRLCLEFLDSQPVEGQQVIDYGCGSGVLGIAAALLGAASVTGVDNDPQALVATTDNAARNGVQLRTLLPVTDPESADIESADLVLANILAGPLVDMADRLVALTHPGGMLVLSGIMVSQAQWVKSAYSDLAVLVDEAQNGDWVRLVWKV